MRLLVFALLLVLGLPWSSPAQTAAKPRSATVDFVTMRAMEELIDRALRAYNAIDIVNLRVQFASDAPGLSDEAAVRRLFVGYYLTDFGRYRSRFFLPGESGADPDRAMLVYKASFEKLPKAKLSVNFTRENGVLKIAQIRIEKAS